MEPPRGKQRCACLQTSQPAHLTRPPPTIFSAHNQPSLMARAGRLGPGPCNGGIKLTLCPTLGCSELGVSPNTSRKGSSPQGPGGSDSPSVKATWGHFSGFSCPLTFYWKRELKVSVEASWRASTQELKKRVGPSGFWMG